MSFQVAFYSEPHIANLSEVVRCSIHPDGILVLKQRTYFSAKMMQWVHGDEIWCHVTVTRKHQHNSGRTEYECQLRDNSLQDLLGHWTIITSGFTKTIITDIIWYFVTIDKVWAQKPIYSNVPICFYSQGFTLEIWALFPTNL